MNAAVESFPMVCIRAAVHPLRDEFVECQVDCGTSLADIIGDLPRHKIEIWLDGEYLDPAAWDLTIPGADSIVVIRAVPQEDIKRALLMVGIAIAAAYTGGLALFADHAALGALVAGGITLAGTLLVNALIPPTLQKPADEAPFTRLASLTGARNQIGRFTAIPRLLGKMKYFPPAPMTGTPYTYVRGDLEYIKVLLILGYGPLDINGVTVDNTGIKTHITDPALLDGIFIDDTPISQYPGVWLEIGDPMQMTLYSQRVSETRVDLDMNSVTQVGGGKVTESIQNTRSSEIGVTEIAVDFEFPQGLFSLNNDGSNASAEVSIIVEYRLTGSADPWVAVDFVTNETHYAEEYPHYPFQVTTSTTIFAVRQMSRQTIRRGVKWAVTPVLDVNGNNIAQYDVRVTRSQTWNQGANVGSTSLRWLNIKSIFSDRPFDVPNVVGLVLDLPASDKISGTLDNVSVLAQSILPVWNGTTWTNQATSSPAWCYNEVLTGVASRKPLNRDTEVDKASLLDWATQNATDGFEFNAVIEGSQTVFDLIRQIAAAGRASWGLKNNLISVIREETEQTPKQLFSPRNATNFKLRKVFPQIPHALRVQFVDPTTYEDTERIVYDDGYTAANATIFEEIQLPGVTSPDQAWKLGRFHLAQMRLRPELWTFDAHIDQLIAQRGDAIGIMSDTFLDGLNSGRVVSCNGGNKQVDPGFESGDTVQAISATEVNTTIKIVPGIVGGSQYALRIEGGTNLLSNPDFESGFASWTLGLTSAWALQSDYVHHGTQALAVTGDGVNAPYVLQAVTPAAPGDTFRIYFWVRRDETSLPTSGQAFINWRDSGGGLVTAVATNAILTKSGWQLVSVQGVAPSLTTHFEAGYRFEPAGTGKWYVDDAFVRKFVNDNAVTYGTIFPVTNGQVLRVRAFVRRDEDDLPSGNFGLGAEIRDGTQTPLGFPSGAAADKNVSGVQEIAGELTIAFVGAADARLDLVFGDTISVTSGAWIIDDLYIDLSDATGVNTLDVDDTLYMAPSGSYKVAVRYIDSSGVPAIATVDVNTVSPSTQSLTCVTSLPNRVFPGDLFVFGTTPVTDAKITKIVPTGDDFTATITAVPLAPAILTADSGSIPAYTPLLDQPVDFNALPPPIPVILGIRSDDYALVRGSDGVLRASMEINFWFPPGQPKVTVRARYNETDHSIQYYYAEVSSDAGKLVVTNVIKGVSYTVELQAYNAAGQKSNWSGAVTHTVVGKVIEPSDVTNFVATVESYGILLSWDNIPDLDRSEYEIRLGTVWNSATFFWRGKGTNLRTGIQTAGTLNFLIKSIDTALNYSVNAVLATATITAPGVSGLTASFVSSDVKISWTGVKNSFDIREYEIRRGGTSWADATPVTTIRTNVYRQLADWVGNETWRVAAIDVDGNVGVDVGVVAMVTAPTIQSVNPQVIDNNVLLRWVPTPGTLPIARYEIRKGQVFASAEIVGLSDTTFSALAESQGGQYTYWVSAEDTAGNMGAATSVTTTVNEPPDFALQSDFTSDGLGNNTSAVRISRDHRSMQFTNGLDKYVSLPQALLNTRTDCTVEMAVAFDSYPPAATGHVALASWDGATNSKSNFFALVFRAPTGADNTIRVDLYPYGQATVLSWVITGDNLYDGRFRMYSIRRNQTSGNCELFVNGVSQGTKPGTLAAIAVGATDNLLLGTSIDNSAGGLRQPTYTLDGRIDEVRFWSTLRTPTEIQTYWNRELDLNETGLVAYYRFNLQGNTITADDISPNDNNGNLFADQNLPIPELLVPFYSAETVGDRNTVHGYTTPQAQITAGFPYVAQPVPTTATIEEIYNCGVALPASRIQVLLTTADIDAGVTYSVEIFTKTLIGDAWSSHGAGSSDVFATNFQYIRVVVTFTGTAGNHDFLSLTQILTKCFVKRKTDEGNVVVSANPTAVSFNISFIDIAAIDATVLGTTFAIPVIDFTDAPNPTGFNVYVFDAAGNALTGRTVHWIARGV